jgi:uncharacterized protein YjbI with pentapeptide repeats
MSYAPMAAGNDTEISPKPLLREVDLERILGGHAYWLSAPWAHWRDPHDLARAHLEDADLHGANLSSVVLDGAQLQHALLEGAHLQNASLVEVNLDGARLAKAKLSFADLRGAYMGGADLTGADLEGTILRGAKLQNATLANVTGLLAEQLGGTNLTGATLPPDIAKFASIDHVAEISRNAKTTFLGMLAACAYSWLAIATTSDLELVLNSVASPLPIINTSVPIVGFYWAAPVILLAVYIYFHLYLQRLWDDLTTLPAVFPDGIPLDGKAYPWLLNGLVRPHFARLSVDQRVFTRLENLVTILLAWWLVPFTLLLFWGRYILRHDAVGTAWHLLLTVVAIGFGVISYRLAKDTLRNGPPARQDDVGAGEQAHNWRWLASAIAAYRPNWATVAAAAAIVVLSIGALSVGAYRPEIDDLFEAVGYRTHSEFPFADISTKPADWRDAWKEKRESSVVAWNSDWKRWQGEHNHRVIGASLNGARLDYVNARGVFLAKAQLGQSDLTGAILDDGVLQEAEMTFAILAKARLSGTKLQGANLGGATLVEAELPGANLSGADLQNARISRSNLAGATLIDARLKGADLSGVWLSGAVLTGADLSAAVLSQSHLEGADLTDADLTEVDLAGADLDEANLKNAKLDRADFTGARLSHMVLDGVVHKGGHLKGVDFQYSSLVGADLSVMGIFNHDADLSGAYLGNANFTRANLSGSDLSEAQINEANFDNAVLADAILAGAKIRSTEFRNSDLSSAVLTSATISRTGFEDANLSGADLRNAILSGVDLANANLSSALLDGTRLIAWKSSGRGRPKTRGTNLTTAKGLTQAQLDHACGDEETELPQGLHIKWCQ